MLRTGRDEHVDTRPVGVAQRLPAPVDVGQLRTGQPADGGGSWADTDRAGDRLHGFEVTLAGHRESGLDVVDTHPGQLLGDLELLGDVEGDPRRLLSVTQGCVEDDKVSLGGGLSTGLCRRRLALRVLRAALHSHRSSLFVVPACATSTTVTSTSHHFDAHRHCRAGSSVSAQEEAPWPFGAGGVSASAMWRSPSSKKQVRDEHMHTHDPPMLTNNGVQVKDGCSADSRVSQRVVGHGPRELRIGHSRRHLAHCYARPRRCGRDAEAWLSTEPDQ